MRPDPVQAQPEQVLRELAAPPVCPRQLFWEPWLALRSLWVS
jgi:hypothetical protein